MATLYEQRGGDPKFNAQANLSGRTHYVDDGTLKWHKARILSAQASPDGLLYYIIESVAIDPDNTRRGVRFVVFDLFGHVISRVPLEECWRTRDQASKALYAYLDTIDAKAITAEAIEREERSHAREIADLRERISRSDIAA